ncbi:hypothetical protein BDV37DRAFT_77105 [Aspergillus pseudonomiae]|uniref:Secreted protein n=1 Tax=Aspergillus pseudonomiae TaxID=1506151 RepID=A0A5N7DSL1_9EURO|nr:uncharacterized protein BDV37DRAFT_77105 [Aspergillus pseudonomiae]KAE8409457.1 hypothetical protein BDV37DRAFT_77105 [Aspergillus pseudonomiae]
MLWFIFLVLYPWSRIGLLFRTFRPQNTSVLPHSESVRSCSVQSRRTFHFRSPLARRQHTRSNLGKSKSLV